MYEKHTTSTCTRTPILHVRKSRPAYIHINYPNSACTKNTPGLHTWTTRAQLPTRRGLTRQRARPTPAPQRGLLRNKKYLYLKKNFLVYIHKVNMRGTNSCEWLLLGKTEVCGKSCMGKYCKTHNARIAKGGSTICGKGVKNQFMVCKGCGYHRVLVRFWQRDYRAFSAEVKRLTTIERF